MTIKLPADLEISVQTAVHEGRFASVNDAMTEAARLLIREFNLKPSFILTEPARAANLGSIGLMNDSVEELDAMVADAMKNRCNTNCRC